MNNNHIQKSIPLENIQELGNFRTNFLCEESLRSNRQSIKSFRKFFVTASVKDFLVQISYTFKLIALIKSYISFIQMYVTNFEFEVLLAANFIFQVPQAKCDRLPTVILINLSGISNSQNSVQLHRNLV